jgi:hypothetical protein
MEEEIKRSEKLINKFLPFFQKLYSNQNNQKIMDQILDEILKKLCEKKLIINDENEKIQIKKNILNLLNNEMLKQSGGSGTFVIIFVVLLLFCFLLKFLLDYLRIDERERAEIVERRQMFRQMYEDNNNDDDGTTVPQAQATIIPVFDVDASSVNVIVDETFDSFNSINYQTINQLNNGVEVGFAILVGINPEGINPEGINLEGIDPEGINPEGGKRKRKRKKNKSKKQSRKRKRTKKRI